MKNERKRCGYFSEIAPLQEHSSLEHSCSTHEITETASNKIYWIATSIVLCVSVILFFSFTGENRTKFQKNSWSSAWSSDSARPFSVVNPASLGMLVLEERPKASMPGPIFQRIQERPLPTNTWCENFFVGDTNTGPNNKAFQIPYIVDTAGKISGLRSHPAHVQALDRQVMMTYEPESGLTLGAAEEFLLQPVVVDDGNNSIAILAIVLAWETEQYRETGKGPFMQAPIVRGSPYTSMLYNLATPYISSERPLSRGPIVDGIQLTETVCGLGRGVFSSKAISVQKEVMLTFDTSDMTWMIFFSEPTDIVCSNFNPPPQQWNLPPGVLPPVDVSRLPQFELRAIRPMKNGMVRVALANNCTTGQNAQFCENGQARDQSIFTETLRDHAEVYPTGKAKIQFLFPLDYEAEEETRLNFDWAPASMNTLAGREAQPADSTKTPAIELLMYATPHHQERIRPVSGSSNRVLDIGCIPTLQGTTCPVLGGLWSLVEHAHRTSFSAAQEPKPEMIPDIQKALEKDIEFQLPENYMYGAGDTYFSGKMLARLARILIIADELETIQAEKFQVALSRLRSGVEIWLNGSANSPLLYDKSYGGVVMCGCDYNEGTHRCNNIFPNCPALTDIGQNFGAGFYNDHHFHFGYHIYAAAVVAKFDADWGRKYFQNVLLLIRDIANPSVSDPFFPLWRHKDWYLGFSWAKGIDTLGGSPYPNGCNEESSSEAINAYEAVSLYGAVLASIFEESFNPQEMEFYETACRIRDMGRLLLGTELRSAKVYWHVQAPGTPGVSRIYPPVYSPKVVGMIWSLLVQEQTWFGNEPWKSYGIQLLPLTVAAELRDTPSWIQEMLPFFQDSCNSDPRCESEGWSVLVYSSMATIGRWEEARAGILGLKDSVFDAAGGNGHSRTNSLWFIATRPPPDFSSNN